MRSLKAKNMLSGDLPGQACETGRARDGRHEEFIPFCDEWFSL
jgi:hypothetical protein